MYEENSDKKYESFKIPGRSQDRTGDTAPGRPSSGCSLSGPERGNQFELSPGQPLSPSQEDDLFYEIEYDDGPFPGVGKYVLKAAKIEPPRRDEIRERFDQMRDIARQNRTLYFRSTPFYDRRMQEENSRIFYKQGIFMKDFEDHYEKSVPYTSYFPFYQMMGYEQLRTYFTWRTRVREGTVAETSLSYAFLYIYELLANIGVADPGEGLEKLLFFWKEFRAYDKTIDKYVLKWLKDYHVYYELPHTFREFVAGSGLEQEYPGMWESEDDFDLLCAVSKYDLRRSAFYTEDRAALIRDCFAFTAGRLREVFGKNGLDFDRSIFQPVKNMVPWTPFQGALFYPWMRQRDRRVVLSEKEIYVCSQNCWKFHKTITTESGRQFLGYVMKQMEAVLRKLTKYKYFITTNTRGVNPVTLTILREAGLSLEELITGAVREFYREATKTVVRVDAEALERIRREALLTQEKLTVEEEEEWRGAAPGNDTPALDFAGALPGMRRPLPGADSAPAKHPVNARESLAEPAKHPVNARESLTEPAKLSVAPPEPAASSASFAATESESADSWQELKSALTGTEQAALRLLLRDGGDQSGAKLKKFADSQGIMLEILMDGINEKAMDAIGDSLLDSDFAIYEDYIEQVKEMVEET